MMQQLLDLARFLDAIERPVEAAWAYELALAEEEADIGAFLDLAVLYFVCCDHGYASHFGLVNEFITQAWTRCYTTLDRAETQFGRQEEIQFWRLYFRLILEGAGPFVTTCRELAGTGRSLVPCFYLFVESDGREYRAEVAELLEQVKDGRTERQRYIKSVLGSPSIGGRGGHSAR